MKHVDYQENTQRYMTGIGKHYAAGMGLSAYMKTGYSSFGKPVCRWWRTSFRPASLKILRNFASSLVWH